MFVEVSINSIKKRIMKYFFLFTLFLGIAYVGCSPLKKVPSIRKDADIAFQTSNYQLAYQKYSELINLSESNQIQIEDQVINRMAFSCKHVGRYDEAATYFMRSLQSKYDSTIFLQYAGILNHMARMEEEIDLWNKFSSENLEMGLSQRSFDRLLILHKNLSHAGEVEKMWKNRSGKGLSLESYLVFSDYFKEKEDNGSLMIVSNELLKYYPDNAVGLKNKAIGLYNKAEGRYKSEMDTYNKNKNATTYALLKHELKKISGDYRNAKDILTKLHLSDPSNELYIRYLVNVNLRLDNKDEAFRYDRMLKK